MTEAAETAETRGTAARDGRTGRDLDVVLLGATGFTGTLIAEYLAAHAPTGLRWALAGRDRAKLSALRERLGVGGEVIVADVGDPGSLDRLAGAARVVVTTVGPYTRHGEGVVSACARAGTDYLDLCGEPEFIDLAYVRHHAEARRSGARLVHACGFDSVPHDLGTHLAVRRLRAGVPIRARGYVRAGGMFSGGTLASALEAMARARPAAAARSERDRLERGAGGNSGDRRVRATLGRPGRSRDAGGWVLPLPTADPAIVTASARALPEYGPDFTYSHFAAFPNPLLAAAALVGFASAAVLAQPRVIRSGLTRLWPSGSGPSPRRRARAWFRVRIVAEGGGERSVVEVAGGDPGYTETATMIAESALCLALDDLPATAGQVTTAVAMGDALRARLEKAGIGFTVVEP